MSSLIVVAFGVAACGAAATPAPATPAPTTGATAAPTERVGPPPGQASSFTVAGTAAGIGDITLLAAVDGLRAKGYTIDMPELAESELVTEGVASGQFQIGSGANNASMIASEKGAPVRLIVDRNANEWTVVTIAAIETCEQLAKSKLAIHSPGSVSGAMIRDWIKTNCPGAAPWEPLIVSGSQNRAAALLVGQIDSTPAELRDWINIKEIGGDAYRLLVDFATDLPQLHPTSMYGNTEWMAANPDVVKDLIKEMLLVNRSLQTEPGLLLSLYQKYFPAEAAEASAQAVADAYRDLELFPVNGGLNTETVAYTGAFFGPDGTGDLATNMTVEQIADLSYLDAVLAEIGRQ